MGARGLSLLVICLLSAQIAGAQTLSEAAAQSALAWQQLPLTSPPPAGKAPQASSDGMKSPWAAVGLSLLLPGAGHVYADAPGRAKAFFGAEAIIWSLALVFDRREAWKDEDAVNYAVAHAQLDPTGKDDDFLERLEFYQNREEYNTAGRIIDPTRPYLPETADTYWQWDATANREAYRDMRNSADVADRNRTFAFYAALLNRVVASLDAYRIVHGHNALTKQEQGLKLSLDSRATGADPRIMLHASLSF